MIAFTPLVIEPNYSLSINDIDSSVFVNVSARRHRLEHPPNDELENRPIWVKFLKPVISLAGMLAMLPTILCVVNHDNTPGVEYQIFFTGRG
jgi:hypothetical protein